MGTRPLLWQRCGSARPSGRLPRRVWAQEPAGSVLGGGEAQPVVAPSVLRERQGQGGLEGGLFVDAVVLEDRGGAGRDAVVSRGHPCPVTSDRPASSQPSRSWVPGTSWQPGGGWSGCPEVHTASCLEDTAPSDGGLDRLCTMDASNESCPFPPDSRTGGEASTPVFLPSGPSVGGAEAGPYEAGCLEAGRGREE